MNETNRPLPLIAIGMCPPKWHEYLQDQEDRMQTYADLRAEIIRQVDLSEATKEHNTKHDKNGPLPMDIGGLSGQHSDPAIWWNIPPGIPEEWNWNVPEGGEVDLAALYAKGTGKGKKGNPWEMKGAWGSWKGGKSPWKGSPGKGEAEGSKGGGKGSGKNPCQFSGGGKRNGSVPVGEFNGYCNTCGDTLGGSAPTGKDRTPMRLKRMNRAIRNQFNKLTMQSKCAL